ncbi:MAG: SH3 domain-containing protein [Nitrosomonadales bacterium]|nr:SH3 domain-containing protein [Nitrosomonadales bacterium]
MKKQLASCAVFCVFLFCAGALHAQAYYVQSISAKVRAEPSFKAKVIAEVGKGKMLTATGLEGSWIKVKIDSVDGYIPSLLLSTHPPLATTVVIKAEDTEIKQGVRRRASSFSSAAAARGLTKEDRQRDSIEEGANYNDLKKMESLHIPADEVTRFNEGGK